MNKRAKILWDKEGTRKDKLSSSLTLRKRGNSEYNVWSPVEFKKCPVALLHKDYRKTTLF